MRLECNRANNHQVLTENVTISSLLLIISEVHLENPIKHLRRTFSKNS